MAGDLKTLRFEIDRIDAEMIRLFEQRMQTVRKVGEYKRTHRMQVLDAAREDEVIRDRVRKLKDTELEEPLRCFFRSLMKISRSLQQPETRGTEKMDNTVPVDRACYHVAVNALDRIVLIGMPASGKSTLGKKLALTLGMGFLDTDAMIEAIAGMEIPEIFKTRGEQQFRSMEADVIRACAGVTRCVIATGGGVVLSEMNMEYLKSPGTRTVWVHRPFEEMMQALDGVSRPLAGTADALKKLWQERQPLYRRYRDVEIENTGNPHEAVKKIIVAIENAL